MSSTTIYSPGDYSFEVSDGNYYIGAWMDVNYNLVYDAGEPAGFAINKYFGEQIF